MKKLLLFTTIIFVVNSLLAQDYRTQYFDGADTNQYNSIFIEFDSSANNVWEIGKPQKAIFDSAATFPNVLITDTINFYPDTNISTFQFEGELTDWGVFAVRWKQKIDFELGKDGGYVEYSLDSGDTWVNAFDNPNVYNYYGYEEENVDTLENGQIAFTGTDTVWRDVWLCFDSYWMYEYGQKANFRFTFYSDSSTSNHEGWMIDNLMTHITIIHTVAEKEQEEYVNIYPVPANDRLNIELKKQKEAHIIERMRLMDTKGSIVAEWENIPIKYFINTNRFSDGVYLLEIKSNLKTETKQIVIQHN